MDIFISFLWLPQLPKSENYLTKQELWKLTVTYFCAMNIFPFPACSGEETDYDVTYDDKADYEENPADYTDY